MECNKNLESLTHSLITPTILNTVTQILLSVSLCCYIFSHSSYCSFFFHSLKFYVSAIPFHSLEKGWIFLVCNGILVVLANTASLVCSPSGLDHKEEGDFFLGKEADLLLLESADREQAANAVLLSEANDENNDQETNEEENQEKSQDDDHQCNWEEKQGNLNVTKEDAEEGGGEGEADQAEEIRIHVLTDDEGNETYSEAGFDLLEEEEGKQVLQLHGEEREGMLENLSAEELNQKFEDFIRKMKEELRIEAQHHHLVVVK